MKITQDFEGARVMRHPDGATGLITSINEDSQMVWITYDDVLDDDVVDAFTFFKHFTVLTKTGLQ